MTTLSKTASLVQGIYRFPVNFVRLLLSLDQAMANAQRKRNESFLADSANIYELETRMRSWNGRRY